MVVRKSSIVMSVKLILETFGTTEKDMSLLVLKNVLRMQKKLAKKDLTLFDNHEIIRFNN